MTKRQFVKYVIGLCLMLLVVLVASTMALFIRYNNRIFMNLTLVTIILTVLYILSIALYLLIKYKNLNNYLYVDSIISSLEHNLIEIGASEEVKNTQFLNVPKISVDKEKITLDLTNIKIRKKIETYIDQISTALPGKLVSTNFYFSDDNNQLIIEVEDSSQSNRLCFRNLETFISNIKQTKATELLIDHKHIVDLIEYPHWLISGGTGSGKTYLTQNLLVEAIAKNFEIVVLDIKRSYHAFRNLVEIYETEPSSIVSALEHEKLEMQKRQENMENVLATNPRALAIDIGYKPRIIILEEYIGLMTTLDSKEAKKLESIVKEISVLARSVNISLFIILQSANTENINSSLRHNLNKILLGEAQSNIMIATFGTGTDIPKIARRMLAGEGYIQINGRIEQIKIPQVNYYIEELDNLGRSRQP